jgi:hypothetical protein
MREPDDRPREAIVDAPRLPVSLPDPEGVLAQPASGDEATDPGGLLDLSSLQKSLSNDEAEKRTQRIHLIFKRGILLSLVIGLVMATEPAGMGKLDTAVERLVASLAVGVFLATLASLAYAMLIHPGPDITAATELARRQRRARRAAKKRAQAEEQQATERPLQENRQENSEADRGAAPPRESITEKPRREDD